MPERIQRKRTAGWRMPEGAVYVGRPTKWGNPVEIGSEFDWFPMGRRLHATITTLDEVIEYYRLWIQGLQPDERPDGPTHAEIRAELAGKDLACWCPLDQPCHADVLLEVANA